MSIIFQYNKTSLQILEKQLKVRVKALPTLKSKEAALRVEVKKAKDEALKTDDALKHKQESYQSMSQLWSEFDDSLIAVKSVKYDIKKIAGVKTPVFKEVLFDIKSFSFFNNQSWFLFGVEIIKELTSLAIQREFFFRKMKLLDYARKKTTQKVNLYEKVQIPEYNEAIRKIKRFLEDKENLAKSAMKIVKNRQAQEA